MNRVFPHLAGMVIWLIVGAMIAAAWPMLLDAVDDVFPGDGSVVLTGSLILAALAGLVIHTKFVEILAPINELDVKVKGTTEAERVANAEAAAAEFLRKGRPKQAVAAFEAGGLLIKAIT